MDFFFHTRDMENLLIIIGFIFFVVLVMKAIEPPTTVSTHTSRFTDNYKNRHRTSNRFVKPLRSTIMRTSINDTPYYVGNIFMSAEDKRIYLSSREWKRKRKSVFARDNNKCQICFTTHNLECHHISYEHLGDEPLDHLTTLCRTCHSNLHTRLGYDRQTIFSIN